MADESSTALKDELRAGHPKFGVFVNSSSNTVSEMISHLSFDWVLLDTQHGPMNPQRLGTMISAAQSGGVKVFVRVADPRDRNGAQQALDLGADGIMFPTVNNAEEAVQAVSYCRYPTAGTRSVYHPQRSNIKKGLLGYVGNANKNVIVMCQIETKEGIQNVDAIAAVDGVDVLFLGPNDLCMSTGLFEGKYKFPEMYTSPEMKAMEQKLIAAAKRNNKILGVFVFGTDRVPYFLDLGFPLVSVGNDLHHVRCPLVVPHQSHTDTDAFPCLPTDCHGGAGPHQEPQGHHGQGQQEVGAQEVGAHLSSFVMVSLSFAEAVAVRRRARGGGARGGFSRCVRGFQ